MAVVTNKLAFYHIPRTGGTWVRHCLGRYDHKTPIGFKSDAWKHRPPPDEVNLAERTAFTVVRNPADWLVSWYIYLVQNEKSFQDRVYAGLMLAGCRRGSFDVFVLDYLDKMPGTIAKTWLKFIDGVDVVLYKGQLRKGLTELWSEVGMTEHALDDLAPPFGSNATPPGLKIAIAALWSDDLRDRFRVTEASLYSRIDSLERRGTFLNRGGRVRETVTA